MIDIKIFRANRGEGKTKWLLDRAIEAKENGYELRYIGNASTMVSIVDMWRAELHERCPIKMLDDWLHIDPSLAKYCFLTDELTANSVKLDIWKGVFENRGVDGVWYITMCNEYFVN